MRWFHYTLGIKAVKILATAEIRRARAGLRKGERSAVWFTSRTDWEPLASPLRLDEASGSLVWTTGEEAEEVGGALMRFEVSEHAARHTWLHHRKVSGIDPRIADGLERSALMLGSDPADWRVSYHDVPLTDVLATELFHQGKWIEIARGTASWHLPVEVGNAIRKALEEIA